MLTPTYQKKSMNQVEWRAPKGTRYWTIVINSRAAQKNNFPVSWVGTINIQLGTAGTKSVNKVTYEYPKDALMPDDKFYEMLVKRIQELVNVGHTALAIWKAPQNDKDIWYIVFLTKDMENEEYPFDTGDLLKTKRNLK